MKNNNLVIYVTTIVTLGIGAGIGISLYNSSKKRAKMIKEAQYKIDCEQLLFEKVNNISSEKAEFNDNQKTYSIFRKRKYTELN